MAGFDFDFLVGIYPALLQATLVTLALTGVSLIAGFGIGFFTGWARVSPRFWIRAASTAYVEVVRGTPLVVQIFVIYSMFPALLPDARVPAFWAVSRWLLTTAGDIEVQGDRTSGEVEYALIAHEGRTFVAVASDQTDRHFEQYSIPRSKQLCPKVLSREVVVLDEVIDRWDGISLTSEISADGQIWHDYQRATLEALLDPGALVRGACGDEALPDGTVLLSGTVPLVDGVTRYLPHFRAELVIPHFATPLRLTYSVSILPDEPSEDATT